MGFVCFEEIIVEVKAVSALTPGDEAQLLNYLAMSKLKGLALELRNKVARVQKNGFVICVESVDPTGW